VCCCSRSRSRCAAAVCTPTVAAVRAAAVRAAAVRSAAYCCRCTAVLALYRDKERERGESRGRERERGEEEGPCLHVFCCSAAPHRITRNGTLRITKGTVTFIMAIMAMD
ncbi:hypothetical protein BHE74_00042158, partial [Ensete ventricosum]